MSQCYIATPSDDAPDLSDSKRESAMQLLNLRRKREIMYLCIDDVDRMLDGIQRGDAGFRGAGNGVTFNAAFNALEEYFKALVGVETEITPARPLPVAKPFGRRIRDADLPAVASIGSL